MKSRNFKSSASAFMFNRQEIVELPIYDYIPQNFPMLAEVFDIDSIAPCDTDNAAFNSTDENGMYELCKAVGIDNKGLEATAYFIHFVPWSDGVHLPILSSTPHFDNVVNV